MATLKYVTQHPELGVTVRKTFCVGSPFDVPLTLDTYLGGEFAGDVAFLPLLLVSINESQQLNIPYDHLFKGELLANWQSWILSKDNKFSKIGDLIGTDDLSEVLADGFLARTGPDYEAILNTCRRYSLTSGWMPPPATTTKIFFYHSENDDVVPFGNFTSMQAFLDETIPNGYESESVNVSGSSDLETLLPLASRLIDEW